MTKDYRDYSRLSHNAYEQGLEHFGVLMITGLTSHHQFGRIAALIVAYSELHPEGLPPYCVDFVSVR